MLFFDVGTINCSCNLDHSYCNDNKSCRTDLRCQRYVTMDLTNSIAIRDDQLCPDGIGADAACSIAIHGTDNTIAFVYCCRENFCNKNDTAMYQFLYTHILSTYVF